MVNTGLDPTDPRVLRHTPTFARTRPDPLLVPDTPIDQVWGDWPGLVTEAARAPARSVGSKGDPSALIAHADLGEGRVWATGSVTLVALGRQNLRYAFTSDPADPDAWYDVQATAMRPQVEHRPPRIGPFGPKVFRYRVIGGVRDRMSRVNGAVGSCVRTHDPCFTDHAPTQ